MNFFIKKIFDFLITLVLVSLVTFIAFNVIPGNPALIIYGPDADEVLIEQAQKEFNLDKPLYKRYFVWLSDAVKGDFGKSYRFNQSVNTLIKDSSGTTLTLALFTIFFTALIGFPLGIFFATSRKKIIKKPVELFDQLWISIPSYCTALILILIFTVKFSLFPSMGFVEWNENPFECMRTIFLPSLSLALGSSAILARYLKTSFLQQKNKNYVYAALSKGLSESYVNIHHIFINAVIPVITISAMTITEILGGSIIIENVFSIPGIGKLIMAAISARDFPLIQGLVMYLATITITCNFAADILYGIVDPKIRQRSWNFKKPKLTAVFKEGVSK